MRMTKHEKRLAILDETERRMRLKQAAVTLGLPPGIAEDVFGPVNRPYWEAKT